MGLVIDNTTTRWGAAALLIGALPLACCVFWPFMCRISAPPATAVRLCHLSVSVVPLPTVNIPFCAMLPFLTSDSAERTTLSAVRICWAPLAPPSSPWLRCRWSAC